MHGGNIQLNIELIIIEIIIAKTILREIETLLVISILKKIYQLCDMLQQMMFHEGIHTE